MYINIYINNINIYINVYIYININNIYIYMYNIYIYIYMYIYNKAKITYETALKNSGYQTTLKFQKPSQNTRRN